MERDEHGRFVGRPKTMNEFVAGLLSKPSTRSLEPDKDEEKLPATGGLDQGARGGTQPPRKPTMHGLLGQMLRDQQERKGM